MKHLKLHHNYMSMKMKYHEMEFPSLSNQLSGNGQVRDGFGHIVEVEKGDDDVIDITNLCQAQVEG